jgi:hypothetical protein
LDSGNFTATSMGAFLLPVRHGAPKVTLRQDAKPKATTVDDVWSVDVVFDTTHDGNTVKFLMINYPAMLSPRLPHPMRSGHPNQR